MLTLLVEALILFAKLSPSNPISKVSSLKDLKLDKKSSKLLAPAKVLLGLVLLCILHSEKGGSCLKTLRGFCLVNAPITNGAITLVPRKIGVCLTSLARGFVT